SPPQGRSPLAALTAEFGLPLRSFSLELALEIEGTVALVGPSGAGKTTVLRAIAGLARPERGHIRLDDRAWFDAEEGVSLAPEERSVGLVFQDYALFPHLTVRKNVAFGARSDPARVDELLERLRISHLADERPGTLSGGERQRVALARALAREPRILLLDEPFGALDAKVRGELRDGLRAIHDEIGLTSIFVTHDHEEAFALGDRVAILNSGRIEQFGTPAELVEKPATDFVRTFLE
ncbi:MAG TPA: ABC transporter ATP-binding protein, partial [Allosphingosinicella sp.]|nr:ABC transporter ATP-binding protein [Allosphingosinicella sp.]